MQKNRQNKIFSALSINRKGYITNRKDATKLTSVCKTAQNQRKQVRLRGGSDDRLLTCPPDETPRQCADLRVVTYLYVARPND